MNFVIVAMKKNGASSRPVRVHAVCARACKLTPGARVATVLFVVSRETMLRAGVAPLCGDGASTDQI